MLLPASDKSGWEKLASALPPENLFTFFFLSGFSTRHPEHFGEGDLHRKQTFPLRARARGLELSVHFLPPREVVQTAPPPRLRCTADRRQDPLSLTP